MTVVKSPPCIVILGQTRYAKALLVNEVFRTELMPLSRDVDSEWRMVRFSYATLNSISLSIPEENYELMDDLHAYKKPWNTVPVTDLAVSEDER